ncbi:MAG: mechanosensitive ion channel [Deltaproteobacteria bacterium]|nr:mechanosensitive ion channel [Deltaproteobacteria bacterium]
MPISEIIGEDAVQLAAWTLIAFILLTFALRYLTKQASPLRATLAATRNLLLPTGAVLYYLIYIEHLAFDSGAIKILRSIVWIEVIWIASSLVKVLFFTSATGNTWRSRVPGLFVDIIRFATIVIGTALVIAGVWNRDLGAFLATLGVGSIVLGLALQDTLGSLMAGIALLFERPFNVGEWVKVGDVIGRINEINWRSVAIVTRDNEVITVPNSVISKERIHNFSRPTSIHGVILEVRFSYNDPPNKVKRVMLQTIKSTTDVISHPRTSVRTKAYLDFYIVYQVRFFISNYDRLPEIESDFMTRVWYAAKRNNLTIPFPVRTVFKSEVPYAAGEDRSDGVPKLLRQIPLFNPLTNAEIEAMAGECQVCSFARDEVIVEQGEEGTALFVINEGLVSVRINEKGKQREIARLGKHQFFGEMALLSGEPRTATVAVLEDAEVIVVDKEALAPHLEGRPELAGELADIVVKRQHELHAARLALSEQSAMQQSPPPTRNVILQTIKEFFRI